MKQHFPMLAGWTRIRRIDQNTTELINELTEESFIVDKGEAYINYITALNEKVSPYEIPAEFSRKERSAILNELSEHITHGFYNVTVTGPGKNETIRWVPSVTTAIDLLGSGFESSSTLQITFPYTGDYTVTVEPMDNSYASSNYWLVDRLLYWMTPATWSIIKENQCYTDYSSSPQPSFSGTVYIYCYDEYGNELTSYSQMISSSTYITPPNINGYRTLSSSTYVQLNTSSGSCNPSTICFYYTHNNTSMIPQFPTGGYTVWLRNHNVERIQPQCGPGYNFSVFASMSGSTKLYNPREITYLSAHFCVGNWVYIEFGYSDNVQRFGFFEKSLFTPSTDWNSIPSYSLDTEKQGRITTDTTPYNGPSTNCGSYASCKLYPGDAVYACMECNGWYLCRFYNNHGNNYGDVYLWIPGYNISWYK